GMTDASYEIIENLYKISSKINSEEQLEQVATVSANNDIEIGKLISTSLNKVGREGIVTIEESRTGETYLETVEGMQFDRGYKSPHLVTNTSNMSSVLENPNILIYDKKITQAKELLPILEWTSQQNSSLLIIAEDIDGEALATLIVNKMRGILKICAVKAPDFGERRALILEDIAILTGGTVVSQDKGMKLDKFQSEWFGKCRIAHITKENTTLIDGSGDQSKIESHILDLQSQIDNSKSPYEIEKFQERLAKMVGGVSIIHVGGNTETEMREKKDRVDDALHAAKAAIEEGIVPGGGVALIRAYQNLKSLPTSNLSDYQIGKKIVYDSCYAPFYTIMTNAGYSPSYIYDVANKIKSKKDYWMGFDLKSNLLVNLKNKGIIDPTKVTRNALSNAVSVAGTLLLTETVITEEKPESQSQGMNLMEGMY
ncbi:MAG: molecular chaperone GroEL, partial [Bacteroidota bacterium]